MRARPQVERLFARIQLEESQKSAELRVLEEEEARELYQRLRDAEAERLEEAWHVGNLARQRRESWPRRPLTAALHAKVRYLKLLQSIHAKCQQAASVAICAPLPATPSTLEDFVLTQRVALESGRNALCHTLPHTLSHSLHHRIYKEIVLLSSAEFLDPSLAAKAGIPMATAAPSTPAHAGTPTISAMEALSASAGNSVAGEGTLRNSTQSVVEPGATSSAEAMSATVGAGALSEELRSSGKQPAGEAAPSPMRSSCRDSLRESGRRSDGCRDSGSDARYSSFGSREPLPSFRYPRDSRPRDDGYNDWSELEEEDATHDDDDALQGLRGSYIGSDANPHSSAAVDTLAPSSAAPWPAPAQEGCRFITLTHGLQQRTSPYASTMRILLLTTQRMHVALWEAGVTALHNLTAQINRGKNDPRAPPAFYLELELAEAADGHMYVRCEPEVEVFRAAFESHVEALVDLICSIPQLDVVSTVGASEAFQRPLGPATALREAAAPAFNELLSVMRTDCERISALVTGLNALPAVTDLKPMAKFAPDATLSSTLLASLSTQVAAERLHAENVESLVDAFIETSADTRRSGYSVGIFCIGRAHKLKGAIRQVREERAESLLQQLKGYVIHRCSGVQAMADTLNKQLSRMPDSPEELYELKLVIMERQNYALDAQASAHALTHIFDELERLQCPLSDEEAHTRWELKSVPSRMSGRIERAKNLFRQLQNQLKQQLVKDVSVFNGRVAKAVEAAHAVSKLSELAQALEHVESATKAEKELAECMRIAKQLNAQEDLFGLDKTNYSQLPTANDTLEPYVHLWQLAADWLNWSADWYDGEFLRLNPKAITEQLQEARGRGRQLRQELDSHVSANLLFSIEQQVCHQPWRASHALCHTTRSVLHHTLCVPHQYTPDPLLRLLSHPTHSLGRVARTPNHPAWRR